MRMKMAAAAALLAAMAAPALAGVSPQDGYGPDGKPALRVELAPYLWVPAVSGKATLGNGASAAFSQGMPTLGKLESVLTGAFMGDARLRYGPWSAELNIQYVAASQTHGIAPDVFGIARAVDVSSSMTRVAPGVGYQVFNGLLGDVPATVDARVGFAWFSASSTVDLDRFMPTGRTRVASVSDSGSFAQPWVGVRAALYPWPRWRFEVAALGQGLGVSGDWGWSATATATWAATDWLNLIGGFSAINNTRHGGASRGVQTLDITAYGPMLGISFTF